MADEKMNEKLFETVLYQALKEVESEPNPDLPLDEDVEFSEAHKKRMKKLFDAERKKLRRKGYIKTFKYMAACLGLLIVVSSVTVMSVSALRIRVLNFIFNTEQTNTEITSSEETEDHVYDDEELSIEYLPDGFVLQTQKTTDQITYLCFGNGVDTIDFLIYPTDGTTSVDTENAISEKMVINGYDCLYSEIEHEKMLTVFNSYSTIVISSTINKNEIIKIAQNLKIK